MAIAGFVNSVAMMAGIAFGVRVGIQAVAIGYSLAYGAIFLPTMYLVAAVLLARSLRDIVLWLGSRSPIASCCRSALLLSQLVGQRKTRTRAVRLMKERLRGVYIEFCRHGRPKIGYKGLLSEVLARVKSRAVEGPRGPDVVHRVKVRREWLTVGEVVELELPRNLACAACGGGGCDACGRSGAITLRKRDEPAEVVEVTLPARSSDELPDSRGITLRIPEQGGLPPPGSDLPRGVLLLTVVPSPDPDPSIKLLRGVPSKRPPAIVDSDEVPTLLADSAAARRFPMARAIVIVVVVLWILLLIWLRISGHG